MGQCGLDVGSLWNPILYTSATKVDRCGLDVDSLWNLILYTSAANVDRCGLDVDSMWTRSGLLFSILVRQMWTHTPFSIYNNKRDVGGESTRLHLNIVLGPRGCKRGPCGAEWPWNLQVWRPLAPNIPEDN